MRVQKSTNQYEYIMKKVLFLAAFLPAALLAQNITNTLGASGSFVVEDNTNKDVLLINPGSLLDNFIFGLHPSASILPVGNYHFLGTVNSTSLDVYSLNTTPLNGSFIQLIRARGNDFNNPGTATAGDFLGTINFGAYNGTGFSSGLSSISSKIVTATGANPNVFSSDLEFQTASGSGTNKMTFDNAGNLNVPGSVVSTKNIIASGSIVSQKVSTIPAVGSIQSDDKVLLVNTTGTLTLPGATNTPPGTIYTIKNISGGALNIQVNGADLIDNLTSITLNSFEFVQLWCDGGSKYYIIGR